MTSTEQACSVLYDFVTSQHDYRSSCQGEPQSNDCSYLSMAQELPIMIPDPQFVNFLPRRIEDSEAMIWVYSIV